MKKLGKISGIVGALALGVTFALPHGDAHASVAAYPYNGLSGSNYSQAMNVKSQVGGVSINKVSNPHKAGYSAVGRVTNLDGWKGHNKDSMGTGFIVGPHTYITNLHVVQDGNGKIARAQDVKMVTERNGSSHKYTFNANKIERIPGADAVMIHTRQDMGRYVKPFKLASTKTINGLKLGTQLKAPGYDKYSPNGPTDDNTKLWESHARYLKTTSNGKEIMNKQVFRSGGSGSPILTSNNQLIGISAYGWNLNGTTGNELAGGFKFTGSVRDFIQKHTN